MLLRSLAWASLALMVACVPKPVRIQGAGSEGQAAREASLAALPDWSFRGRLAINNAGQAGNARIEWRQRGPDFEIRLSAPVTRQSWVLRRQGGESSIEGLEGGPRTGPDAQALLLQATGWRIPVDALASWVRGARSGAEAVLDYDPQGLPAALQEGGWTVEYRAWKAGEPPLPTRLFARQGEASVRLAIEDWNAP